MIKLIAIPLLTILAVIAGWFAASRYYGEKQELTPPPSPSHQMPTVEPEQSPPSPPKTEAEKIKEMGNHIITDFMEYDDETKTQAMNLYANSDQDAKEEFHVALVAALVTLPQDKRLQVENEIIDAIALVDENLQTEVKKSTISFIARLPDVIINEAPESDATELMRGELRSAGRDHKATGSVVFLARSDTSLLARLENFRVTKGPRLHIYLTKHPAPTTIEEVNEGFIDLGELRGNTGNQNYTIPEGTEIDSYKSVTIYAKPFDVIYATATMQ